MYHSAKPWSRKFYAWCFTLSLASGLLFYQTTAQETGRRTATVCPAEDADVLLGDWRKVERRDALIGRMGLRNGHIVADVGAGLGWYSLEMARAIAPRGVVFAVDIQPGMLERLDERMNEAGIDNIYPVLSKVDDPLLPPGKIDWVVLVDAYHEFSHPQEMLEGIKRSLAPGGRVALLEFRAEQKLDEILPFPMTPGLKLHFMSIQDVVSEWTAAGFELEDRAEFLPAQHVFVFKAEGDGQPGTWQGGDSVEKLSLGHVRNFSTFGEDVYFAGQPAAQDFEELRALGVDTVINLRTGPEMEDLGFDEQAIVREAGMQYLHIPMGGELPPEGSLDEAWRVITEATAGGSKVLVHCASANRVGAVWAGFRRSKHGLPIEEIIIEARKVGLRSPTLEQQVRQLPPPR